MRRALRWLWRLCRTVVLLGMLAAGASLVTAASHPAMTRPAHMAFVQQSAPSGTPPTPQENARAQERARRGRLIFLGSWLYQAALLGGFLLLGGTRWLAGLASRFGGRWVWGVALCAGIVTVALSVLMLPLDYYSGFIFEHQYGLSNQTAAAWFRDYLVSDGVDLIMGFPLVLLLYLLLRRAPRTWWLWMAAASVPVSVFLVLIQPVFITPLFNKFTSLQDETLRHEILTMAHAQGIAAHDVYEMDASRQSNAANAYVNGFGPTMRIVLYDTLVKDFTRDEVQFIMAHEMGHYKLGHIYQGIAYSVLGILVGGFAFYHIANWVLQRFGSALGFTTLGDPASYPLLLVLGMVFSLLAMPIGNAFSRQIESQADRFAVRIYPHPDAGISAFHKLARLAVSEEDPPRWAEIIFYTHPSITERIARLERVKAQMK